MSDQEYQPEVLTDQTPPLVTEQPTELSLAKLKLFVTAGAQPTEILGLKLRHHSAETDCLLELLRSYIRDYLAKVPAEVADGLRLFYGIAAVLFVHAADRQALRQLFAGEPQSVVAAFLDFVDQLSQEQVMQAAEPVARHIAGLAQVNDWETKESRPDGPKA